MSTYIVRTDRDNSRRRYTLQPPGILPRVSTNWNEEFEGQNGCEHVDDPYVKELLRQEIDFSKYDRNEEQVQLLNIPNVNYPRAISSYIRPEKNFETRRKSPLIRGENVNEYSSGSYSSSNF